MKKAIILAGGFGNRLKDVIKEYPKPMVSILGKPLLEHQLNLLKKYGIEEVILAVHYMSNTIKSYFGNGLRFGMNITYSEEETPLGTAGAIKKAQKYIDDTFFVLNGDTYIKLNLDQFLEFHKSHKKTATISLIKPKKSKKFEDILFENKITLNFVKNQNIENLINTGFYIFEPEIFKDIESNKQISLEKEIFNKLLLKKQIETYIYKGYFMDIDRPETYKKFKEDMLKKIEINLNENVRSAIEKIMQNEIDLTLVTNNNKKLIGVITDRILKKHFINGGSLEEKLVNVCVKNPITAKDTDSEEKISRLLLAGINHLPIVDNKNKVLDVRFRSEEIKIEEYPIIRGKNPLRISFSGGGTDLPKYFEKYGGIVINSTIDKYCYITAIKRADSKIIINSDMNPDEKIFHLGDLNYDGNFNLIKSIINLTNLNFGVELYLHNDIPPGRGLGSSASFSVLLTKIFGELKGEKYSTDKLAEIAYKAEREELNIKGGWQDQYAAAIGGFNYMEFNKDKKIIYPLRLKEDIIEELNSHLLLCYVGKDHFSGEYQNTQEVELENNEQKIFSKLENLKKIAVEIKDSLLKGDIEKIGYLLNESWKQKRKVTKDISNPLIDNLYNTGIKNGALGGKLLGAGGGGYLLFYYLPNKRKDIIHSLEDLGGEITDFNFENKGIKTWRV